MTGGLIEKLIIDKKTFNNIFSNLSKKDETNKKLFFNWLIHGKDHVELDTSIIFIGEENLFCIFELREKDQILQINKEERQADLATANQTLLRNLGHEVKNPLGGIRGAAQLLDEELPSKELKEYTQIIIKEADRLKSLVDKILFPTKQKINSSLVNIHELTERVRKLIISEFGSKMKILIDYDVSIPMVPCDGVQMMQVILNIVKNSAQALKTIRNPEIVLRTRVVRQLTLKRKLCLLALKLEIIDNGPGIADEIKDQIFYPLVSGSFDGHGIGLTVAQSIVHAHGGLIECSSEQGETNFTINIPILFSEKKI